MKAKGTKNDIKNRGIKTHDEDRTLIITLGERGKLNRRWETVPGIRARLSAVASAPNGRRLSGKTK